MDFLFKGLFLAEYFDYLMNNKNTLLSKLLGVYEVKVGNDQPLKFFITENMLDNDLSKIINFYDLKGSLHQRIVQSQD